jgi:hypothetical protein
MPLLSPFEAQEMNDLYGRQFDEGAAKDRAARQQPYAGIDPAQQAYFNALNDAEQQGATGPAGYNRQWVGLLQALKGKRFVGGGGLPTETYGDLDHTGHLSLMPQAEPTSVGVLKKRAVKTTDPPMAEDQDEFLSRLYKNNPPDWYRSTATATAAPTPAPPTTPPRPMTLPSTAQPPLGSVTALARQLGIDDDEARAALARRATA